MFRIALSWTGRVYRSPDDTVVFQCFSNKILILHLIVYYLKYFVSLKLHSELATHRGEPVTLPLNVFVNVQFSGSIVVFSLTIIIIVQKQPVLMHIYTCIITVMVQ